MQYRQNMYLHTHDPGSPGTSTLIAVKQAKMSITQLCFLPPHVSLPAQPLPARAHEASLVSNEGCTEFHSWLRVLFCALSLLGILWTAVTVYHGNLNFLSSPHIAENWIHFASWGGHAETPLVIMSYNFSLSIFGFLSFSTRVPYSPVIAN